MGQETLVFRRGSFSLPLSLLMSAFALVICPANLSVHLQPLTQRSPTTQSKLCVRSFGILLSPVTSSAQADSTSELLRFL